MNLALDLHGCHAPRDVKRVLLLFSAYDALTEMLESHLLQMMLCWTVKYTVP